MALNIVTNLMWCLI